jgi:hypothetical protein
MATIQLLSFNFHSRKWRIGKIQSGTHDIMACVVSLASFQADAGQTAGMLSLPGPACPEDPFGLG